MATRAAHGPAAVAGHARHRSFKQCNEHYGPPARDRVLRTVARTAAAYRRRPADLAVRYGGEEIVLLPETDGEQAQLTSYPVRRR